MTSAQEQEKIIAKMFAAAMREKFCQLARKYGQETMFQSWVEYVKERGGKGQALEGRWNPDLSLAEALDILEEYSGAIERSIQERLKEERKKRE